MPDAPSSSPKPKAWYYAKGDQQIGPISASVLKSMAHSGELAPDDQVWQAGMAEWRPAKNVKELFPTIPVMPSTKAPPTLPQSSGPVQAETPAGDFDWLSEAQKPTKTASAFPSFVSTAKSAGQLAAKQAERTKLVRMNLPTAFLAFGKSIYGAGSFKSEFPEAFKAIDDRIAGVKEIEAQEAGRPNADGIAAKAKAAGQTAMDLANKKKLRMQTDSAIRELGRRVFEKHGKDSSSDDVVLPVVDLQSRIATLDAEIIQLSKPKPGQIVTPKRFLIVGVVLIGLIILGAMFGRGKNAGGSNSEPSGEGGRRLEARVNTGKNFGTPGGTRITLR